VQALEDSYNALKTKFHIALPGNVDLHINKFELFNNSPDASICGTFLINHPANDCYISFIKIHYRYTAGRSTVDNFKCQAWAFVNLKKDFGRVLIRRETFTDRIMELVHPVEVKFADDKIFTHYFYVVANDHEKATAALTEDFRNVIKENVNEGLVIEIVNYTLIIGSIKPITPELTIYIAAIANKLASIN
jgi:hypothetical protein